MLIHAVMLIAAAATITAAGLLGPEGEDLPAVLGVGVTATAVLGAWSLALAVRALRKGEASRLPQVVLGLLAAECVVGGAVGLAVTCSQYSLLDWAVALALPVFIPVLALAALAAAPVAWWRTKRAEKKAVAKGEPPWSGGRRWKRGLLWYCPVAALVFAVAVPIPLFVFCAHTSPDWMGVGAQWHRWTAKNTPRFVGEGAAMLLSSSQQPLFTDLYRRVLRSGRVSGDRLVAELQSPDYSSFVAAWVGLMQEHKELALDVVRRVGSGEMSMPDTRSESEMAAFLARHVGTADLKRYLDPAAQPWPSVEFTRGILGQREGEYAPYVAKLEQYCDAKDAGRAAGLRRLAQFAPPRDFERLWPKYLADKDPERRKQAIAAIAHIPSPTAALNVFAAGLESSGQSLRRELAGNIQEILLLGYESAEAKVVARTAKALLPFLDDEELAVRQDAAWVLVSLIQDRELEKRVRSIAWTADDPPKKCSPLSGEAKELVGEVRAAARRWLGTER